MRTTALMITLLALLLAGCSASVDADGAADGDGAVSARAPDADGGPEPAADGAAEPAVDGAVGFAPEGVAAADAVVGSAGGLTIGAGGEAGVAPGVTVSGSGQASGTPDVVRVTVGVSVVRDTVDEALDAANASTERVLAALDDAGVAAEDRQTRDFSIFPQYGGETSDGSPRITGFTVSNLVEAKIRDVDRVGGILTAVADAGGDDTRIQGVRFALEDDSEQVAAARRAAFADARARAEQYAELAGVSLGGLIGITDVSVSSPRSVDEFAAEAAAADAAVPIEPGTQQVVVTVTVRWALE